MPRRTCRRRALHSSSCPISALIFRCRGGGSRSTGRSGGREQLPTRPSTSRSSKRGLEVVNGGWSLVVGNKTLENELPKARFQVSIAEATDRWQTKPLRNALTTFRAEFESHQNLPVTRSSGTGFRGVRNPQPVPVPWATHTPNPCGLLYPCHALYGSHVS